MNAADPTGYGSLEVNPISRGEVLIEATDLSPKHSEASMIRLVDGSLLLFWSQFLDIELMDADKRPPASSLRKAAYTDDGYARICAMRSYDGGHTWSDPWVAVDDRDAQINCICPEAVLLPDTRIMLIYSWRSGGIYAGKIGRAERRMRLSADAGKTWTDPVQITPDEGYHTGPSDRLRILSGGRIIAPCHTILKPGKDQEMAVYTAYSDDQGENWHYSNQLIEPRKGRFEEGCLVERSDGSLLMIMRTYLGQGFLTESHDQGKTWQMPRPSGVVAPAAPSYLTRLPLSDFLLLIWNPDFNPAIPWSRGYRCPLICALSEDGGNRWQLPLTLDSDPDYWWEYPGLLFHQDQVLIHYRRVTKDRKRSDLMLCRVQVKELLAMI